MALVDQVTTATTTRRYWSVRRIAERWSCSKGKIYGMLRSQDGAPPQLPSLLLNGMVRVKDEDLAAYEAKETQTRCRTATELDGTANAGSRSSAMVRANADVRLLRIAKARPSARSAS